MLTASVHSQASSPVARLRRPSCRATFNHPFERTLDASTFVAVTKTYGGDHTHGQYRAIERTINDEFGGAITKVKDAALYLATCVNYTCGASRWRA